MKKLLLPLLLLCTAGSSWAADTITLDAEDVFSTGSSATSHTYPNFTVADNPNRTLLLFVGKNEAAHNGLACTYGGVSFGSLQEEADSAANAHSDLYRINSPTVGTADIVCTQSNAGRLIMSIHSYYNVSQATTFRDSKNTTTNTGANSTTLTLNSAANDLLIDFLFVRGNAANDPGGLVPGAVTEIEEVFTGSIHRGSSRKTVATGTSITAAWTWTSTSSDSAQIAVTLVPSTSKSWYFYGAMSRP